ncbi:MAG: hypothetical protein H0V25_07015 [Solirubrobacterales bacterium]|nr:hypothetical protein [Solirubrobacterales bacterium]
MLAFASGYPALFTGLVPVPRAPGETTPVAVPPHGRSAISTVEHIVRSAVQPILAPIRLLPDSTAFRLGFLFGGLLAGALILFGFTMLPPRIVRLTPVPVQHFLEARSYVALLAVSLVVAVALAYALGSLVPKI